MAFVPLGLLYGADADYACWLYQNLLLVIAGNIVGGGIAVGGAAYFLYGWTRLLDGVQRQQTDLLRHCQAHESATATKADAAARPGEAGSQARGRSGRAALRLRATFERGAATPPPDPALVRALFVSFDGDDDGQLDEQELPCALHALGFRYRLHLLLAAARASVFSGGDTHRCEGMVDALFDLRAFEAAVRQLHELEGLGLRGIEGESAEGHFSRIEEMATC